MPITKMVAAADGAKAPAPHKGGGACLSGLCLTFVFALFAVARAFLACPVAEPDSADDGGQSQDDAGTVAVVGL